ncbi:lipopolysaccharide transport periplasmic protein LptA [Xylophilus sp.]|uniref:lipopolysaccharide transport periplasmic protein LptA n=1 Tax=Xylophilus sp. TaxID=2653893 RepID=UPI0013BAA754|nr:lipopolysaccharide transport periplasmic protein LptA [Xylophilus sp.]KAF1044718.1 MAG: Lipopolysaccharide export system protein LptA [Xylophilus sp.]
MKTSILSHLVAALFVLACGAAHAERADRAQPMNIEADALRHDDLKQTSVFTGRVVMTKGTIVIRGARLDVRQDADGYQYGVVTGKAGKRAFFRQKRDTAPGAPEEFVEGEGETIEYDGRADNVKFIRQAAMRRYQNATLNDELSGDVIVYDNVTGVFTIDGRKTGAPNTAGGGTAGSNGRVRAVLAPKGEAGKAPPAPPPAGPAPSLRSSTTLDGQPR